MIAYEQSATRDRVMLELDGVESLEMPHTKSVF
jgi:hypothetical protein